jgi:hypothetical protein
MISRHHRPADPPAVAGIREFDLRRGIITTDVTPAAARCLTVLFLVVVFAVPLGQIAEELRRAQRPTVLSLFDGLPTRKHLHSVEEMLETTSVPRSFAQRHVQLAATRWGGFGNMKCVVGRDGWLFYAPGVDLVTGRGILDPERLKCRAKDRLNAGEADFHPDPRPAVAQFAETCRQYGATLVLVPLPDKASLQPAQLSGAAQFREAVPPPQNPGFAQFVEEMGKRGVEVFDATPTVVAPDDRRFLAQDTHWTPEWMDEVARALADRLRPRVSTASPESSQALRPQTVSRSGDLVDMLRLPAWQQLFSPQEVSVQYVVDPRTRLPWQPRTDAEVLFLGDSFANIYSLEVMGWGDGAGFVEHLSFHLRRPIDRIVRNDNGAWATRQALADELARGKDRLRGKKIVIWEFASRELMVGNWRPVTMQLQQPEPREFVVPHAGRRADVTGRVEALARPPRPGTVPYKDHIVALHLSEIESDDARLNGGQALIYLWSMRNNVWTAAARWQPGQRVRVTLRPWADVEAKLGAVNRGDLSDEDVTFQEPCWGDEVIEP